jgi:hypothetical protein
MLSKPSAPRDRGKRLVLDAGADYWLSKTAPWTLNGMTVRDAGIGRFKLVTSKWRLYTMSSVSANLLRRDPLPARFAQSELQ